MGRFNYYDDYPLIYREPEKSDGGADTDKAVITLSRVKKTVTAVAERIKSYARDEALEEIREIKTMPNLQERLLKITAVVMFFAVIVIFVLSFSHTIFSQNKKINKYYADAGKVCTDYINAYGTVKWEKLDSEEYGKNMARMTGLCYARQMDFDRDGSDELMLCYNNKNVYTLEVWGYKGKKFIKFYSDEANKTKSSADGSWISFYYNKNKYYICKSLPDSPDKVTFYALKGDKFKKSGECLYDYKNNIYTIDGEIVPHSFETIKLSAIRTSKAEVITDIVTANIDSFNTVTVGAVQTQKTPEELKAAAYYDIVETRNKKYGSAKAQKKWGSEYLDGVAYVDLIDFNNDKNEELLLVFRKMVKESSTNYYTGDVIIVERPAYCIEVYSWNDTVTKKIFSMDHISNYLNDSDTNYIMLKNNKNSTVDICINSYVSQDEWNYTASSRIYSMKDGEFQCVFSAKEEDSYGYKNYYIDGERSYRSEFASRGHKVPKFLDDNQSYDEKEFTLVYFSGDQASSYGKTVDKTVETIQKLNKNYLP